MRNYADAAGGEEESDDEDEVDPDPLAGVSAEDRTAILKAQMEGLTGCCDGASMLASIHKCNRRLGGVSASYFEVQPLVYEPHHDVLRSYDKSNCSAALFTSVCGGWGSP